MGFSVPPCLRPERWALTPPFHPCRPRRACACSGLAVCFLWHCPSASLAVAPPACTRCPTPVTRHRTLGCSDFPLRACARSGGLLPHLFTLTPTSLPRPRRSNFLWHFPSARLAAAPPACISPPAFLRQPGQLRGIAPFGVRTFLLPRIASGKAILRPSKITLTIPGERRDNKLNIRHPQFPAIWW